MNGQKIENRVKSTTGYVQKMIIYPPEKKKYNKDREMGKKVEISAEKIVIKERKVQNCQKVQEKSRKNTYVKHARRYSKQRQSYRNTLKKFIVKWKLMIQSLGRMERNSTQKQTHVTLVISPLLQVSI